MVVVVLGDFGRSPRMQYHALSLAEQAGRDVHVVAYGGSAPHAAVASHPRITLHALREPPASLARLPRPLALAVKAALQLATLLWALLWRVPAPSHYLLQTPPCVPTFAACLVAAALRRARLVVDWHNFAYSLMALTTRSRPLPRAIDVTLAADEALISMSDSTGKVSTLATTSACVRVLPVYAKLNPTLE